MELREAFGGWFFSVLCTNLIFKNYQGIMFLKFLIIKEPPVLVSGKNQTEGTTNTNK
jgi:hypothetical protein